jgi:hypothetical protein
MIARMRAFLAAVSRFMGLVWLTVLYFTLILPFGIVARVRGSMRPAGAVAWSPRQERAADLAEARKQF